MWIFPCKALGENGFRGRVTQISLTALDMASFREKKLKDLAARVECECAVDWTLQIQLFNVNLHHPSPANSLGGTKVKPKARPSGMPYAAEAETKGGSKWDPHEMGKYVGIHLACDHRGENMKELYKKRRSHFDSGLDLNVQW